MPLSSANIISDMVDLNHALYQYNGNGIPNYIKIDRGFLVDGLTEYSTPEAATTDALSLVRSLYPVASICPDDYTGFAKARGYETRSTESDDEIFVLLSYIYSEIPVDTTVWTIETDTYLEVVQTDAEYNQSTGNLQPIIISYQQNYTADLPTKPTQQAVPVGVQFMAQQPLPIGQNIILSQAASVTIQLQPATVLQSYASVGVLKPRQRLTFTRTIYGAVVPNIPTSSLAAAPPPVGAAVFVAAANQYVGTLNSRPFQGQPRGSWICFDVDVINQPFAASSLVRLVFILRPIGEGWLPWARYANAIFGGVPPNVFRTPLPGGTGGPNGIRPATVYQYKDFNTLVALLP